MKKLVLFFSLFSLLAEALGQAGNQAEKWMQQLENPAYADYQLKAENAKDQYLSFNFSTLLTPRNEFLGFIGSDFQRLHIYFNEIQKDAEHADTYLVKGISLVHNNKCDFEGTINIRQVRAYKKLHFGVDNSYTNAGIQAQGVLVADYEFSENPQQQHVGTFKGTMTLNWYLDEHNIMHYDDIEKFSDSYRNNQYVGVWRSYANDEEKICNWGEYRIPFSEDLDVGAGEFFPNTKYADKGWKGYPFK